MSSLTPGANEAFESGAPPRYSAGTRRGSFVANFADGASLEIEPTRARAYPGLRGEAPAMLPFYEAFAALIAKEQPGCRVLDAGCGSGTGSRRLLDHGLEVVAVDSDPTAIAFTNKHAPKAETLLADLARFSLKIPADAAILADVLSQVHEPDAVLVHVARALTPGAQLLISEPTAHVSQRLSAPQRRGFSVPQLRSQLVRAGFSLDSVVLGRVPFVALLARADAPQVAALFARAHALASNGDMNGALELFAAARVEASSTVALEILLAEAEIQLARGDGDSAARAFFLARELAPEDSRPFVGLGRIALAGQDANDTLSLALNALRLDATDPAAYALAAVAADALGHPDAFTAWRAAANLAPDDLMIADALSNGASARGDHRLALANLERLERYGIELSSDQHLTRAWLLLKTGRRNEAAIEARIASGKQADPVRLRELELALGRG